MEIGSGLVSAGRLPALPVDRVAVVSDARVLVAGGGPVGMLLAAELAFRGVEVVVAEASPTTVDTPRAGTLHARTVQSLTRRGYLRTTHRGKLDESLHTSFHFAGLPILSIAAPAAEGPPTAGYPQADLERLFERRARDLGVDIRRGHRLVGLRQTSDAVAAEIQTEQGGYALSADYLVGCDGARSTVRREGGFDVSTHPATFTAIVAWARLHDASVVPPGWTYGPVGCLLANVNPVGVSRLITHDFRQPLPERGSRATPEEFSETIQRILRRKVEVDPPSYLDRFSDFTRIADDYRSGRVFLAGDAAHVHAPLGGQGLNTGLQDALNLAWKLASVVRGETDPELLDTYGGERRPVAEKVIDNTRVQAALMRPGEEHDSLRAFVTRLFQIEQVNRYVADEISGQGIRYGDSAGPDGTFLPNLALHTPAGRRTVTGLLSDGRPLLILARGDTGALERVARRWGERIHVVKGEPEADSIAVLNGDGRPFTWQALACRPDGHLVWGAPPAAANPDDLDRALRRWFGPPSLS